MEGTRETEVDPGVLGVGEVYQTRMSVIPTESHLSEVGSTFDEEYYRSLYSLQ